MEDEKIDFRVEIRIMQFWRNLLGEAKFARFRQEDLLRWYLALELAGPVDIREQLMERRSNHILSHLHGVVDLAPHPPTWLVEDWLATHEQKVRTAPFWYGLSAFTIVCFIVGLTTSTCSTDYTINPLALNPQPVSPVLTNSNGAGMFSVGNLTQNNPAAPSMPNAASNPYPSVISVPTTPAPSAGSSQTGNSTGSSGGGTH